MSVPSVASEAIPARAGLPFDADDQGPARDGRLHRSDPAEPAGQGCGPAGLGLSRPRACRRAERLDRPPRGAQAALKRPAAGSDRSEQEGQSGTGPKSIPRQAIDMAKPPDDDIEAGYDIARSFRPGSSYIAEFSTGSRSRCWNAPMTCSCIASLQAIMSSSTQRSKAKRSTSSR